MSCDRCSVTVTPEMQKPYVQLFENKALEDQCYNFTTNNKRRSIELTELYNAPVWMKESKYNR